MEKIINGIAKIIIYRFNSFSANITATFYLNKVIREKNM